MEVDETKRRQLFFGFQNTAHRDNPSIELGANPAITVAQRRFETTPRRLPELHRPFVVHGPVAIRCSEANTNAHEINNLPKLGPAAADFLVGFVDTP